MAATSADYWNSVTISTGGAMWGPLLLSDVDGMLRDMERAAREKAHAAFLPRTRKKALTDYDKLVKLRASVTAAQTKIASLQLELERAKQPKQAVSTTPKRKRTRR